MKMDGIGIPNKHAEHKDRLPRDIFMKLKGWRRNDTASADVISKGISYRYLIVI